MDDVLKLIAKAEVQDVYGIWRSTLSRKEVFCQVRSITRAEFFEAGRNGLNPSFEFVIFAGEYNGERMVEYRGETYAVYRTYLVPGSDYIELYVQREGGTNGAAESNS